MTSRDAQPTADWCERMIMRVIGLREAAWTGPTKGVLLELLKATGARQRISLAQLGELVGRKERAVRDAIDELETLGVGEWVPGRGSRAGEFAFDTVTVEGLTGGGVDQPDGTNKPGRVDRAIRARASRTSTKSYEQDLIRPGVPTNEAEARAEALDHRPVQPPNGRHPHYANPVSAC